MEVIGDAEREVLKLLLVLGADKADAGVAGVTPR